MKALDLCYDVALATFAVDGDVALVVGEDDLCCIFVRDDGKHRVCCTDDNFKDFDSFSDAWAWLVANEPLQVVWGVF